MAISLKTLPLYASKVAAGFPSPAEDYIEGRIDLNRHLISNPATTFLVRAGGNSMIGAGIFEDDTLIVDRNLTPREGRIVIASIDGELTVKRLKAKSGTFYLEAENENYPPIILNNKHVFIWGVVTYVIHKV